MYLFDGMSKKDKRGLIITILLISALFFAMIFIYFKREIDINKEEVYEPVPFFDELYSTFWSGYLSLPFMDRGYIGIATIILLCIIGIIIIRKMPAILQWTFLPTFYVSTYQFNGQDISRGFQIMPSDMALSGLVNMTFTLIWLMLWGGVIAVVVTSIFLGFGAALGEVGKAVNTESSESDEAHDKFIREHEKQKLSDHISDLGLKRSSIKTHNTFLDLITGSSLSKSELKHNQKRYDKLSKQIEDLEDERDRL